MEVKGLKEAISVLKEIDRGYVTRAKFGPLTGWQNGWSACQFAVLLLWWWPETTDGRVFPSER